MKKNTSGRCTKCNQPLVGRAIKLDRGKPAARCRDCLNEQIRKCHAKKAEETNKRLRTARQVNPQAFRDRDRRYRQQYKLTNPEKLKEYHRKYYIQHKEAIQQQQRQYRTDNPTQHNDWLNKNPDKVQMYRHKRRARKMQATGHVSERDWACIKALYGHRCLWCLRQEPEIKLTMDHVIPLSKGGTHTPQNVQQLCKSCNSKKYNKTIDFRYPHLVMSWIVCSSPNVLQEHVLEPNV